MSKTIKVSLEQRYYLQQYLLSLPCTLDYRTNIDSVIEAISISSEEVEKHGFAVDVKTNTVTSTTDVEKEIEVNQAVVNHVKFLFENLDKESKAYKYLGLLV